MKVLVPEVLDHLGAALAFECREVMLAGRRLAVAVGAGVVEGFGNVLFADVFFEVIFVYYDVSFAR